MLRHLSSPVRFIIANRKQQTGKGDTARGNPLHIASFNRIFPVSVNCILLSLFRAREPPITFYSSSHLNPNTSCLSSTSRTSVRISPMSPRHGWLSHQSLTPISISVYAMRYEMPASSPQSSVEVLTHHHHTPLRESPPQMTPIMNLSPSQKKTSLLAGYGSA